MPTYEELLEQETISQSSHSPGIVQDTEKVARVIFSPNHYKNGKFTSTAFEQILESGGFSILRHDHEFDSSLERTIKLLQKDNNEYVGYSSVSVNDIRNVIIGKTYRMFIVLDTSRKTRKAHADIFTTRQQIVSKELTKKYIIKSIRYEISELFNSDLCIA